MFYSHEVLTSRKYGVATVWLVATLGSKSSLKKVSRKAILDVDVAKACETVVTPQAPMALRLQSNLLYGLTRVYSQQCGYVLTDAESARNGMRALLRTVKQGNLLDAEGGTKGSTQQLMLPDDPSFLLDMNLMPLEDLALDGAANEEMSSLLSRHSSQSTQGSQQTIGGLMLPPSNSSVVGGPVGGLDLSSRRGDSGRGTRIDPPQLYDDDLGLDMGLDDPMEIGDGASRQSRLPSDHINDLASAGGDGRGQSARYSSQAPGGAFSGHLDDGFMPIQDNVAFPFGDGKLVSAAHPQQETTSETAVASLGARKERKKKIIAVDTATTLSSNVLARWQKEYMANMKDALRSKQNHKLAAVAKKNAEHWVLSAEAFLGQGLRGPLDMFSGVKMLETFTGINLLRLDGRKRRREEVDASELGRRVRSRSGEPLSDQNGHGGDDGGFQMEIDNDMPEFNMNDTIEQGREAPTPLDDRHISSIFPWNQSAGSHRPTDVGPTSASFGGHPLNVLGRRGSRLTSASPLLGRGPLDPADTDDSEAGAGMDMYVMDDDQAFELYGPAAQVDTQTAGQSQWQRAALGAESANFLEFVRAAIEEADQRRMAGDKEDETLRSCINFHDLLGEKANSKIVAAQAFLHVLALGTNNVLSVRQEESFGAIDLSLVSA